MTDLTTVNDHPARILRDLGHASSGKLLEEYEQTHDVTFAALDNETLTALQDGWFDSDMTESDALRLIELLLGLDSE